MAVSEGVYVASQWYSMSRKEEFVQQYLSHIQWQRGLASYQATFMNSYETKPKVSLHSLWRLMKVKTGPTMHSHRFWSEVWMTNKRWQKSCWAKNLIQRGARKRRFDCRISERTPSILPRAVQSVEAGYVPFWQQILVWEIVPDYEL